jgi:hypothetical protein
MNSIFRHPFRHLWLVPFLCIWACSGQNGRDVNATTSSMESNVGKAAPALLAFDTLSHDFGTIIEGEQVVCYFDYYNRGEAELVISSVEATCGCTITDWNREPLQPGGKEHLKVVFDAAGRTGAQRKSVTVKSNASNNMVRLTIRALVKENV